MRLLGFNQYGIWPEDDWKTNLIWEAIRLSFISWACLSGGSAWLLSSPYKTNKGPLMTYKNQVLSEFMAIGGLLKSPHNTEPTVMDFE